MKYNLHRGFVMDRVSVDLQNCYGIKALKYDFDFTGTRKAYAIYAPNGSMKSSFALTFKDLSNAAAGAAPRDRIFPDRPTVAKVTDDQGQEIENDRVLVVESYDDKVCPSEKTSTLLVEPKLREQYEQLQAKVAEAREALMRSLKLQSKSKADLENEISIALYQSPNELRKALIRVKVEVQEQPDTPFADIEWDKVFSDTILKALNTKNLKDRIAEYITRYDELLAGSTFFRKGIFDYYNAETIATSLAKNGFFNASHSVNLKSEGKIVEVSNEKELTDVIEAEKASILEDEKLVATFNTVQAALDKNQELRSFREYLMANLLILPNLGNLDKFKQDVIKSYLKVHEAEYISLLDTYEEVRERETAIFAAALEQRTQWEEVIDIFNRRFVVPFTLHVDNKVNVVIGDERIMKLGFTYEDSGESQPIGREELLEYLSNGEKKAFYVLNVIFEIERRIKDKQETLVIVDDLADSFDYQNKYAIIEYLRDISQEGIFKQIILTHNFDFLRTIEGRLVSYASCLMGLKSDTGMKLVQADGIRNIFASKWKPDFFIDDKKKIASIAFLRNLAEFSRGQNDPAYVKLTSMVHWRPDTAALTVGDLDELYREECGGDGASADPQRSIIDLIDATADECLNAGPGLNLENKVVLAIATRMRAERFVVDKLNDPAFLAGIDSNQTWRLISRFKKDFPDQPGIAALLDRVLIMTPENIHLNSFMYEPLIDMSEDQLKKLYAAVKQLA